VAVCLAGGRSLFFYTTGRWPGCEAPIRVVSLTAGDWLLGCLNPFDRRFTTGLILVLP
jgi:hypothetical protein